MQEMLKVKSNQKIAEKIFQLTLQSSAISQRAKSGQFIHLLCGGEYGAFLRRPFSLSSIDKEKQEISIVYRVQGKGTRSLCEKQPGEKVHALGPLGQGFVLEPTYKNVGIVGGGMGIAPLLEVIKYYGQGTKVHLGFGEQPILIEEMKKYTGEISITVEKGKLGKKGFVTEGLAEQWKQNPPEIVYTCGPKPMMKKVAQICGQLNIPCQVSLEERMGCGIGACLVCSCKTKKKDQKNHYSRVCKDGPVYWAKEVLWDE